MKRTLLSLILFVVLCTACRKPHTCVCTILQPNIAADTTTVTIDNREIKAFSICLSMNLTIVNTSTTTCSLKE